MQIILGYIIGIILIGLLLSSIIIITIKRERQLVKEYNKERNEHLLDVAMGRKKY